MTDYVLRLDKQALIEIGEQHWYENLPNKFYELDGDGILAEELDAAATLTLQEIDKLLAMRFTLHEAWEMARTLYLVLPAEEEEPEEPMPPNFTHDSIVAMNRLTEQMLEDEEQDEVDEVQPNGDPGPRSAEICQRNLEGKPLLEVAQWVADRMAPPYIEKASKLIDRLKKLAGAEVSLDFHVAHVGDKVPIELFSSRGVTEYKLT